MFPDLTALYWLKIDVIRIIPDDDGEVGCSDNRITVCGISALFGGVQCCVSVVETERYTEVMIGDRRREVRVCRYA